VADFCANFELESPDSDVKIRLVMGTSLEICYERSACIL
jgi:hypothetical protein